MIEKNKLRESDRYIELIKMLENNDFSIIEKEKIIKTNLFFCDIANLICTNFESIDPVLLKNLSNNFLNQIFLMNEYLFKDLEHENTIKTICVNVIAEMKTVFELVYADLIMMEFKHREQMNER